MSKKRDFSSLLHKNLLDFFFNVKKKLKNPNTIIHENNAL